MTNSKNKQTSGLFAQAFGVAKKLSSELQKLQVAPITSGAKLSNSSNIVEGNARFKVHLKWRNMKALNRCCVNNFLNCHINC